jgi:hypothetical protein
LAAVATGGSIYTSADSGAHWSAAANTRNTYWHPIASSADGTKLVAGVAGILQNTPGLIYTWQSVPTPVLSVKASATNTVLSWTCPSINFVLQQNSTLAMNGWADVPDSPVLDLTSLRYVITLTRPSQVGFYRLKDR